MFVAMAFGREFLPVYRAVEAVAKELDFNVERTDLSKTTERIIPRIHAGIRRSAVVVGCRRALNFDHPCAMNFDQGWIAVRH
jgi:hypothetical protein